MSFWGVRTFLTIHVCILYQIRLKWPLLIKTAQVANLAFSLLSDYFSYFPVLVSGVGQDFCQLYQGVL